MNRTGGQILVDQLIIHGADLAFCVPGESYLPVLDALVRRARAHRADHLPPRERRREHGRSVRQADRCAGSVLRDARSGRDERIDRRAHGVSGFDADDPVHRPGRQRLHGARGVPGDRLPAHVRADVEMGRADRSHRSHSRVHRARLPGGDERAHGAGRARTARRHAVRQRGGRGCASLAACRVSAVADGAGASCREMLRARATTVPDRRRQRLERSRVRRSAALRRDAEHRRSAASFARRICSTTRIRTTRATSASASIRKLAERIKASDLLIVARRAARRDHDQRLRAHHRAGAGAAAGAHPSGRGRAGPRLSRRSDDQRDDAGDDARAGRAAARHAHEKVAATHAAANADYRAWQKRKEVPGKRADVGRHSASRQGAAARRDHHERRGQLHDLGASLSSLSRLSHAARAGVGRDGLRSARRDRRESAVSESHGHRASPATAAF